MFSAGVRGAPVLWLLLCYGSDVKLRVSCQDGSRSHFPGLGPFIVPCTMALLPPAASIHHIPLLSNAHKSPWSWGRWTWQNFTSGRRISENHFPILSLEEVWHDHGIKAVEVTSHQSTALLQGKQRPHAPHIQRAPQFLRVHYDSAVALVPGAPAQPWHSRGSVFPNLSEGLYSLICPQAFPHPSSRFQSPNQCSVLYKCMRCLMSFTSGSRSLRMGWGSLLQDCCGSLLNTGRKEWHSTEKGA